VARLKRGPAGWGGRAWEGILAKARTVRREQARTDGPGSRAARGRVFTTQAGLWSARGRRTVQPSTEMAAKPEGLAAQEAGESEESRPPTPMNGARGEAAPSDTYRVRARPSGEIRSAAPEDRARDCPGGLPLAGDDRQTDDASGETRYPASRSACGHTDRWAAVQSPGHMPGPPPKAM